MDYIFFYLIFSIPIYNKMLTKLLYYIFFSGTYSPFRQGSMQPVRLVVEPGGYEEPHSKPNASPRPSILRKRDHDNSPVKGIIMLITLNKLN